MLSATILSAMKTRRAAILNNLLLTLPVAAALLCSASNASAQNITSFTVPFAFSVNNQNLPAGTYKTQLNAGRSLYLRSVNTGKTQIFQVRPEWGGIADAASAHLTFHRYGDRMYLTQIWTSAANTHSELPTRPKVDQELAKQVPAANSIIEVASK